jgi:hypothetical protein
VLSGDKTTSNKSAVQENIMKSIDIKRRLIEFAKHSDDEEVDNDLMRTLVLDIMGFNTSYKRRSYPNKAQKNQQS